MRLLIEFARQKTEAASPGASSTSEFAELEREVTEIDALVSDLLASSRVDFTALTKSHLDAVEIAKTRSHARRSTLPSSKPPESLYGSKETPHWSHGR